MKFQIIGKNITVTEGIANSVKTKLSKMDKYFSNSDDLDCRVVVRSYKTGAKVEVTIFTKDTTFRAEAKDNDLYNAIDKSIDKLQSQMRKLKTQIEKRYEHNGFGKAVLFNEIEDSEDEIKNAEVVKTKSLDLKPITLDEAIFQMESIGHDFYLYLDTDDEKISVVYRREDGGYGLLQGENEVIIK